MFRLTRTLIDGLKPTDQEYTVWGNLLPGFGVRLRPGSLQKTFHMPYRTLSGQRQRRIGVYSILTVEEARSLKNDQSLLPRHSLPQLGHLPVGTLTRAALAARHHRLHRLPTTANRALAEGVVPACPVCQPPEDVSAAACLTR
jgi:hypothetical protein